MKKLFLALIILIAFAATTSAQIPTPFSLYAGGLISLPQSPNNTFKDVYKNGWHGMAGFGWKVAPNFQAVAKVELHSFAFDFAGQNLSTAYPALTGGSNRQMLFGLDGRFSLGIPAMPIKPFILGGGGLAHISNSVFSDIALATSLNTPLSYSANKTYWNVGAGFELKGIPLMGLFAQIRYVSVQTDGGASSFIPITLGFKFF